MKIKELLPNMKEILDTYYNVDIRWNGGCLKLSKSISYGEYSIAPNNCSCHFIRYYKRYKNFEKELLKYNYDDEIIYLSYGSEGQKNLEVKIG